MLIISFFAENLPMSILAYGVIWLILNSNLSPNFPKSLHILCFSIVWVTAVITSIVLLKNKNIPFTYEQSILLILGVVSFLSIKISNLIIKDSDEEKYPNSNIKNKKTDNKIKSIEKKENQNSETYNFTNKKTIDNNNSAYYTKLTISIVAFLLVLLFIINTQSNKNKINNSNTQTSLNNNDININYQRPPLGKDHILGASEIAWCFKSNIEIEELRKLANTEKGYNELDRLIKDYNNRCLEFIYYENEYYKAHQYVTQRKDSIINQVNRFSLQTGLQVAHNTDSQTQFNSPRQFVENRASTEHVIDVQALLIQLGYAPGPVDGNYGPRTNEAIISFQRDYGMKEDGIINDYLIGQLRLQILLREN